MSDSNPKMTVLITNYNTSHFVELSLYALEKLTKNNYLVLISDNGSKSRHIEKLKRITAGRENIEVVWRDSCDSRASFAHAQALEELLAKVTTPYTAILDSDCTFLLKDWDELLISYLNDKVKITGSANAKGRSGLKTDDFPLQFAVVFETETYRKLNISCMPRDILKGEDTCWEWKPKFIQAGYEGRILVTRNTRDYKQGPFSSLTGVEEYYTDDGRLAASHFGRGSSGGAAKYLKWLKLPVVTKPIKQIFGNIEREKWMNICKKIIDMQIQ
ncbi:MAG: glycosyltransferase family 2 protein [Sedimentisphaerales bacterium]|nr:glycosyltransferase family 2 protein [Sedimentisphaerales bacterium]